MSGALPLSGMPAAWASADAQALSRIEGVCLDIDETLSTRGKLTDEAYSALWALKRAGLFVVPVTGRPAGWCDHIARFWPVDAVVGENGGFTFFMDSGVRKRIDTPLGNLKAEATRLRLSRLSDLIRARFPHARWASDQAYRECDLAIDVCEDVPPWPKSDVEALLALCTAEGAHAKLSSIHVNAWFGDYDKRGGLEHWRASGCPGLPAGQGAESRTVKMFENWLFIGDSPNDEPLFAFFKNSVGVANLREYLDKLRSPPRWITQAESGAGFAEMTRGLIAARGGATAAQNAAPVPGAAPSRG